MLGGMDTSTTTTEPVRVPIKVTELPQEPVWAPVWVVELPQETVLVYVRKGEVGPSKPVRVEVVELILESQDG
jgi:hypothetical protein